MILFLANPSDPGALWEQHKIIMADDFILLERKRLNDQYIQFNQNIENLTINSINEELESYNVTTANFFGLPVIPADFNPRNALNDANYINNQFIRDHLAYNKEELKIFSEESIKKFNTGQSKIYNQIMKPNNPQKMYFIDGPGLIIWKI